MFTYGDVKELQNVTFENNSELEITKFLYKGTRHIADYNHKTKILTTFYNINKIKQLNNTIFNQFNEQLLFKYCPDIEHIVYSNHNFNEDIDPIC